MDSTNQIQAALEKKVVGGRIQRKAGVLSNVGSGIRIKSRLERKRGEAQSDHRGRNSFRFYE